MPGLVWIALGVVVLGIVAVLALGGSRLHTLSRRVGSFDCHARPAPPPTGPWVAGIAQYGAGRLEWWRSWSLAPRPARTWLRSEFEVTGRAPLDTAGRPDQYLVRCRHRGVDFELTMSLDAYTGLTSWLESAPPSTLSKVI
ncbi:MAG: DUF2550 domain-containing protein [Ornithinibacter sp.]